MHIVHLAVKSALILSLSLSEWRKDLNEWSVSECPDNLTLYLYNTSLYSAPLAVDDDTHLWYNSSTAVGFYCVFETIYSSKTTYQWFVNGQLERTSSQYFDRYFERDGTYRVMCAASYSIPDCPPCNRTDSLPVTIYSTNILWLPLM